MCLWYSVLPASIVWGVGGRRDTTMVIAREQIVKKKHNWDATKTFRDYLQK